MYACKEARSLRTPTFGSQNAERISSFCATVEDTAVSASVRVNIEQMTGCLPPCVEPLHGLLTGSNSRSSSHSSSISSFVFTKLSKVTGSRKKVNGEKSTRIATAVRPLTP